MAKRSVIQLEEVEGDVRRLGRRYNSTQKDLDAAIRLLAAGTFPNPDRCPGYGQRSIWKGRVINRDINRGKSHGYRLIWEDGDPINILYIYDKDTTEQQAQAEIPRRLNG